MKEMQGFVGTEEIAKQWGVSARRVRILCSEGKIPGATQQGKAWLIPASAVKPMDGRSLKKVSNNTLKVLFSEADALRDELAKRRPLTQGELEHLREVFTVEYTYASNAIEGNTLTLEETAMVLNGITIDQKPLREHLEAIGHRDAFQYLEEVVRNEEVPLSERLIRELHALVLIDRPEDKGQYRRIPVRILNAVHTPPQPYEVPIQMERLLAEFKCPPYHPIEAAARFHIAFEAIHPFIDGNGRTGRLLLNFMLMRKGYLPINVKFADRRKYYDAFTAFHKDNDIVPMASLITTYLIEREREFLELSNPSTQPPLNK